MPLRTLVDHAHVAATLRAANIYSAKMLAARSLAPWTEWPQACCYSCCMGLLACNGSPNTPQLSAHPASRGAKDRPLFSPRPGPAAWGSVPQFPLRKKLDVELDQTCPEPRNSHVRAVVVSCRPCVICFGPAGLEAPHAPHAGKNCKNCAGTVSPGAGPIILVVVGNRLLHR